WMIDAPASAAPTAASTISLGVTGRYGLMVGVWIEPVTAQVMMTFLSPDIASLLRENQVRASGGQRETVFGPPAEPHGSTRLQARHTGPIGYLDDELAGRSADALGRADEANV